MFKKILIANRGEIAMRINRACHELGISTVAVYSTADADSLHVKFADESVCIGPPNPKESYLNIQAILAAAEVTEADAIHPGYGFLAENADFARACEECGVLFIGPSPAVIDQMGHKVKAKEIALEAGVPILPSLKLQDIKADQALVARIEQEIGFPVLIKAALGGGGRGMKLVKQSGEFLSALEVARSESASAFGSSEVYVEKYCEKPRHIEIQILADKKGHVIHLGERDCSIQRRHQKLIEEAPSAVMSPEIREQMGAVAVELAKKVGYHTVGTVEFIVDQQLNFYFLEMNTRIQVEHPVTEMVTGIDLVREQIRTAAGEPLRWTQSDIQIKGHAIECRITAEDPVNFQPSPGQIRLFHAPSGMGVRLESVACSDYFVPPFYDSMVAKLIVYDENRELCLRKLRSALNEFVVQGIKTSIPLHLRVLDEAAFQEGRYDTSFLSQI